MPAFLKRFFSQPGGKEKRLVGRKREYDSGYFDIIRFFGPFKWEPSKIIIKYLPGIFTFDDPLIEQYAAEMEKRLRADDRLYEGPTAMMMAGFDVASDPPVMTVREVNYGDVAGSSYTLDLKHPLFENTGGTLRNYYKSRYLRDCCRTFRRDCLPGRFAGIWIGINRLFSDRQLA